MKADVLNNLRGRVRFRRKNLNLSLQEITDQTGVSESTLSRFLRGSPLDADAALKLGIWLGMSGAEVFGRSEGEGCPKGILEGIKKLILEDASIPEERREDLWRWFEASYQTFSGKNRE